MLIPDDVRPGDVIELADQGVQEIAILGGIKTNRFSVAAIDTVSGTIILIPVGLRKSVKLKLPIGVLKEAEKVSGSSALN